MGLINVTRVAPTGTTGNNTHSSSGAQDVDYSVDRVAIEVIVEAVGGTPTITYKVQGTFDAASVADGSASWTDLMLLPAASDTTVATDTKTAVGTYVYYLGLSQVRFARRLRLVTSANTNVTYRANLYTV